MIKKIFLAALLLSSLTGSAMEHNNDTSKVDSDSEVVVCRMENPGASENSEFNIENCEVLSQDEADDFIVSQKESATPWLSYVLYPEKVILNGVSQVANLAVQNPGTVIFVGLSLAIQAVQAAIVLVPIVRSAVVIALSDLLGMQVSLPMYCHV